MIIATMSINKQSSLRSRNRTSEPLAAFKNFFGYLVDAEISNMLELVGDWLLCWVEGVAGSRRLTLLCAKPNETEITYVSLQKLANGRYRGGIVVGSDPKLPPSSSLTEDESKESNAYANMTVDAPSAKALVNYYVSHGLPNGIKLKRTVKRPYWLLPFGSVYRNVRALIGVGHFGRVLRGAYTNLPNLPVLTAVKIVGEGKSRKERTELRRKFIREAQIHMLFLHINIVKCHGVTADHRRLALVLELCEGGGLDEHVQKCEDVSPNEYRHYLVDILKGIQHVHSLRYLHRDIALRNCLISSRGMIKISDFGLSCSLEELEKNDKDSVIINVPIRWMAPETLQRKPTFSCASDVWAFGMLIYEIYSFAQEPWPNTGVKQIRNFICSGSMPTLPDRMSDDVKRLVHSCWEHEPSKRPSIDELLKEFRNLPHDKNFPPVSEDEPNFSKFIVGIETCHLTIAMGLSVGHPGQALSDGGSLNAPILALDPSVTKKDES